MSAKATKDNSVERRWTFKNVALALLQGNTNLYAANPDVWVEDAEKLSDKLTEAMNEYGQSE